MCFDNTRNDLRHWRVLNSTVFEFIRTFPFGHFTWKRFLNWIYDDKWSTPTTDFISSPTWRWLRAQIKLLVSLFKNSHKKYQRSHTHFHNPDTPWLYDDKCMNLNLVSLKTEKSRLDESLIITPVISQALFCTVNPSLSSFCMIAFIQRRKYCVLWHS